ncbi:MAG: hypothetical protein FJ096_14900 [Deltaproteobacteria bacterium]|nr:hypothetical protein [Deltaproteobacteria bacterium]
MTTDRDATVKSPATTTTELRATHSKLEETQANLAGATKHLRATEASLSDAKARIATLEETAQFRDQQALEKTAADTDEGDTERSPPCRRS